MGSYFGNNPGCTFNHTVTPSVISISGYTKLPSNDQNAVMNALVNVGPLAINWMPAIGLITRVAYNYIQLYGMTSEWMLPYASYFGNNPGCTFNHHGYDPPGRNRVCRRTFDTTCLWHVRLVVRCQLSAG